MPIVLRNGLRNWWKTAAADERWDAMRVFELAPEASDRSRRSHTVRNSRKTTHPLRLVQGMRSARCAVATKAWVVLAASLLNAGQFFGVELVSGKFGGQ